MSHTQGSDTQSGVNVPDGVDMMHDVPKYIKFVQCRDSPIGGAAISNASVACSDICPTQSSRLNI